MLGLAFKNVWKRKTRSMLTILGILVSIQLYVIMSSIMGSFDKDIQKQVSGMAGRVIVQYRSDEGISFPPLTSAIEENEATSLTTMPNVDKERSSVVLFQTLMPAPGPNMPPSVLAVGIEPGKESAFLGNIDVTGRSYLQGNHEVVLGAASAKHYNVTVGESLTIKDEKFTVVGVLPESNRLLDGACLMPLKTAQNLFVRPSVVSGVMLTATQADQAESLAQTIKETHPKLAAATSSEVAKSAEELLKAQRMFFAMINNTAIVIAAVVVTIVMVMSVFERKKEIGTLKAIGASRGRILGMIMTESLTLSLTGGLVALPVSLLVDKLMFSEWHFDPAKWLETVLIAVILGILAGLWPAWSAQRVNPLESLRYE